MIHQGLLPLPKTLFYVQAKLTLSVLAQIELFCNPDRYASGKVYVLPKHLDEKVARLHLESIGAELTELSQEQAAYIGVEVSGPYKAETYRY